MQPFADDLNDFLVNIFYLLKHNFSHCFKWKIQLRFSTSLMLYIWQNVPETSTLTGNSFIKNNVVEALSHLVYASVAMLAVLTMQDILELDEQARMNSVPDGDESWSWKMIG